VNTDAAVEKWSSALPSGWRPLKLRFACSIRNSNVDKKTYEDDMPVRLCNYTDVYYNDFVSGEMDLMEATATEKEIAAFGLREGDVLITKDSETPDDIAVPACALDPLEDVVAGYHLTLLRPFEDKVDGRFLLRALQATGVRDQFFSTATGITRYGLGLDDIRAAVVPVPALTTQKAIVAYLDRKTVAIDGLIEKKEKLIALLAEKRAALINRAVTKGLNPDVPMKDSGAPWIGEIPAHWEVRRLKYLLSRGLTNGLFKKKDSYGSGTKLVNVADVYQDDFMVDVDSLERVRANAVELASFNVRPGDFFFVRSSLKLEGVAASACVEDSLEPLVFECHLVGARPALHLVEPGFLVAYLNSVMTRHRLVSMAQTTTMTTIGQDKLAGLQTVVPPLKEQRQIADQLSKTHQAVSGAQQRLHDQVVLLQEYRQALITAAVSGQVQRLAP